MANFTQTLGRNSMATRRSYEIESAKLAKATELAIESFEKHGLDQFEKPVVDHLIKTYTEWRNDILNPEPKYRTLASLKHDEQDVFTFFQEGSGPIVQHFWNRILEENLDYQRENKLAKILKRGKIKDPVELEYVTDMIVPAQQTGLISASEAKSLSAMIGAFESGV